jgi:CheY-like chemotaxis protein
MKKIVVVDDQPVLASIYRAKFVAEGFQVEVATDGEQALEVINRTRPDLILLDLMLPKIKGIDVLRNVRANPLFETLPIVVFSNSGGAVAIEEAWAAGASMVLSKSKTSPKQLVESVLSAIAPSGADDEGARVVPELVSAKNGKNEAPNGTRRERILLVEINPEVRALVSFVLTHAGYQVSNADGPGHASLLVDVAHFDLIMMNSALCRDSYALLCRQIRRQRPHLPVVMYSMSATPTDATQAMANGVSRYLTTPEELLAVAEISAVLIKHCRLAA